VGQPLAERRRFARFTAASVPGVRATLRPGYPLEVVDLGAGGVLVEGQRPLRPGARVHLQLVVGHQDFAVAAQVLRCAVWVVNPHDGVLYRGALRFDQACNILV
jgi:hypothetical protein